MGDWRGFHWNTLREPQGDITSQGDNASQGGITSQGGIP